MDHRYNRTKLWGKIVQGHYSERGEGNLYVELAPLLEALLFLAPGDT